MQPNIALKLNGDVILQDIVEFTRLPDGVNYRFGPVTRDHDGGSLKCRFLLLPEDSQYSSEIILNVICELVLHVNTDKYTMLTELYKL